MLTTIRYIFLTAVRDWLFIGLFLALLAAVGVSSFLGGTALVEEEQMKIAFISGSTRIVLIIGLITFVCFHVRRAFDNREIELILSKPISRTAFVLAYWLGFAFVAMMLVIPLSLFIFATLPVNPSGLLYWALSLSLECLLVVAFALFSSLILRSAVSSVLFCFAFYLVSRMMGFFLYILEKPIILKSISLNIVTEKLLYLVSIILPRLDLFGKGKWLIYGVAGDVSYQIFLPQALIYIPFLLAMAVFDFKRKQF